MSEVQSRPSPRGRGSSRGGRGGSSRGGRGAVRNTANGEAQNNSIEEQSEVGLLRKRYSSQLSVLKDMLPNLSSEDILLELRENDGDVQAIVDKVIEGNAAQWAVKKKGKDRPRSKAQEPASAAPNDSFQSSRLARGGRISYDGSRGGRGGRGGFESRGGRGGRGRGTAANGVSRGHQAKASTDAPPPWGEITSTSTAPDAGDSWGTDTKTDDDAKDEFGWGSTPDVIEKPVIKPSVAVPTWASLLKPAVPPPAPKPAPQQPAQPIAEKELEPPKDPEPTPVAETPEEPEEIAEPEEEPTSQVEPEMEAEAEAEAEVEIEPESFDEQPIEAEEPPAQELTEDNVEKLEDTAAPAPTGTQASTVATSVAAESTSASITPQIPVATPPVPAKYTPIPKGTPGRTFRRVLDQQEGVVMPGNHAEVNRTALQFGSMGLSGDLDDDDEIEQAETVSQPPQPSPLPQPVTSLPPTGPSQLSSSQPPIAPVETIPTPRQAPGLPSHQVAPQQPSPQPPLAPQSMMQQQQMLAQYNHRYSVPEQQPQTKQFDTFTHMQQSAPQQPPTQPQAQHPQSQPQNYTHYMQPQQPSHLALGVSSAEQQHYNYYTDRSQPPGFGLYGNSAYVQAQQSHAQQEAGASQQRASSGLGGAVESSGQIPTSAAGPGQVQQPNSRYGAPAGDQNSGHATPSPAPVQTSHQQNMGQYPMQQQQFHPYYNQYMHQNYYSQPNPFSKNMYYPQQYVPSQQYPDHTSSPAGLGGFASPQGRDSMVGIADYSRMNTSAAQQTLPQHSTSGSYGNGIPNFLGSRGLPQDQQQLGATSVGQQQPGQPAQSDDMKFGENKPPTGPSSTPSLQGQPGRPGSATSGAGGLGTQQGVQNPAMYGSHLNPGLHGAHQGQQSGYGVAQGQSANHYSMYSGGYPSQYSQGSGRHAAGSGTGWSYGH